MKTAGDEARVMFVENFYLGGDFDDDQYRQEVGGARRS